MVNQIEQCPQEILNRNVLKGNRLRERTVGKWQFPEISGKVLEVSDDCLKNESFFESDYFLDCLESLKKLNFLQYF